MYQIRSESVKTFIEDRKIKLPRFQRKQTWDGKKNFSLCVSIYKNYPIGISVINEEKGEKVNTKWLLDGRQRKNALQLMSENPEEIYFWAKDFLKFKNRDQPSDIEEIFWRAIEEYLEKDEDVHDLSSKEEETFTEDVQVLDIENDEELLTEETEEELLPKDSNESSLSIPIRNSQDRDDLKDLLNIILICHNKKPNSTGFSAPFDFKKFISNLEYVDYDSGSAKLNGKKLVSFIKNFKTYIYSEGLDEFDADIFVNFLVKRFNIAEKSKSGLSKLIAINWEKIEMRIELIESIENKLRDTLIGIIDLKNSSSTDAQNIFKLINSGGTDLTAVEILSAKPSWNLKIEHPSAALERHVNELYNFMTIKREDVVRWDFPATLLGRLENLNFVFKDLSYKKETEFRTRITLGFKILAAIFESGITKARISDLSKNQNILWEEDIELLVTDLNEIGRILSNHSFFKFLLSWNTNLISLTSDTIAINFLVLLYKDWIFKGRPTGSNTEVKKFQKNSIILFDRMIYEYVTKQWRGPSDSKLADNISNYNSSRTFEILKSSKWTTLLKQVFEENSIQDDVISVSSVKPLLYYYYFLAKIDGPNNKEISIEIDHIIPQALFESAAMDNKVVQHNLYNLSLIPKGENISKGKKKLNDITDPWLIRMIEKYTSINSSEFSSFSSVNSITLLKEKRVPMIFEAYEKHREQLLME